MNITNTQIQNLKPIQTIAIHHVGDYSGIANAFRRLGEWADANGYWAKGPRMAGIYHDNPAEVPADKLRSSACLEDKGGMEVAEDMDRYEISGGKYLVMTAEVTMSEYGEAWQKAYGAVVGQGLECDARDHYELYISCVDGTQGDDAPWIVEFCIPVK